MDYIKLSDCVLFVMEFLSSSEIVPENYVTDLGGNVLEGDSKLSTVDDGVQLRNSR